MTREVREVEAEDVEIADSNFAVGQKEYRFRYKCVNCGVYHEGREISARDFSRTSYALECGRVCIVMPWAVSGRREAGIIPGSSVGNALATECLEEKRFERWGEKSPSFKKWRDEVESRALDAITSDKGVWTLTGVAEVKGQKLPFPNEYPMSRGVINLEWRRRDGLWFSEWVAACSYSVEDCLKYGIHLCQGDYRYSSRLYRVARTLLGKEPTYPLELNDLIGLSCSSVKSPAEHGMKTF